MQLQHEFTLPIPPDQAWATLLDVERVASCLPGAALDHIDGDAFSGRVSLKVGPLKLAYRGDARLAVKDEKAGRLVIEAAGREARGSGTAKATVTASLQPVAGGTRVGLLTELALTGRPAQFGRGLVSEVGGNLIGQFAERLSQEMSAPAPVSALGPAPELGTVPAAPPAPAAAPVAQDLDLAALLGPVLRKRAPVVAVAVLLAVVAFLLGRRKRG
ncbi:SRPBCC family protein [Nonomuraea aridisoli]|uniref:Carbon monoxide dehydrogenase n=1 Tax=Nonomuraea aridisoli TaxID=2070368 RepID=A0A2W2EXC0_9ACTN|nr:SRPBCC family protein [Nonomuraea aridisoli]PZG08944.1 carbon monoxide dehydrogenase [Nonomuraea aridisoli]